MHWLLSIALVVIPSASFAATPEQNVQSTVERLWQAWEAGDEKAAAAVYDPTLLDTSFFGIRRQWPEVRVFLKPNPVEADVKITLSDFRVKIHGKAAVASYLVLDCRNRAGKRNCINFAASDFLMKRKSGWRIVGAHQSMIRANPATATGN